VNTSYDLRCLSSFKHLRACLFVLFGLVHSFQVNAQSATYGDVFGYMYYGTSGNATTVNSGGSSSTAVRNWGWSGGPSSDSNVNWGGRNVMRNPSGNPYTIDVIAKTPGAKAAKILSAGAKALPIIGTGVMLWELCKELGFGCEKSAGGEPAITKSDPSVCTTSPCYLYRNPNVLDNQWSSGTAVCNALAARYPNGQSQGISGNGCVIIWTGGQSAFEYVQRTEVPPASSAYSPSSIQELEDAIAAKSGWPTSSHIHDALQESAKATGVRIPLESPVVTGPSTSPGTTSTTTNPSAGTTTTKGTTYNHTYNDNRVSTTITTSVNVTNNSTGQGTTTTTTEEPVEEQSECEKNPNTLNCSDLDTPEGDIPKTEKRITYEAENLGFAGGSCPADVVQTIAGKSVKLVNWQQNCGLITTYAKPMILALASFAALMIIFVGGKPE
jgi:hypothetical protein